MLTIVKTQSRQRNPLHAPLGTSRACLERDNLLQVVRVRRIDTMDRIEYLKEQIARAERMAKEALDKLTIDRLKSFAAECKEELARSDVVRAA